MKKVIYIPRKKGAGTFNVELNADGGSYVDFPAYYTANGFMYYPFTTGGAYQGGGHFNYFLNNSSGSDFYYNVCLRMYPDFPKIHALMNAWNFSNSSVGIARMTTLCTPFYKNVPSTYYWAPERVYYPFLASGVGRQNVVITCNNVYVNGVNENIAVVLRNDATFAGNFFRSNSWGNDSNGTRLNAWVNLYERFNNAISSYSGSMNADTVIHPVISFGKCIQSTTVNMSGINMHLSNCDDSLEGVGYNAQQFNNVIIG